jgi:adenosine deaminase
MRELVDLHIHVGGAVAPHILWSIAHQQGYKLPVKSYREFEKLLTYTQHGNGGLDDYLQIMHKWTERLQSSPAAIERSVYETISKEYRESNVTLMDLRFNPMKRNENGDRDLDHIINAAIVGMNRAKLEYVVEACLIFCMAREFDFTRNKIILDKAIKYKDMGVKGVDIAGTEKIGIRPDDLTRYHAAFTEVHAAGLGVTAHLGETSSMSDNNILDLLDVMRPHRIGHGVRAGKSATVLQAFKDRKCVIELCPTSNIKTNAATRGELADLMGKFRDNGIPFTINTDGPQLLDTNMAKEMDYVSAILPHGCHTEHCLEIARSASFINK